ncbi:hypothetical protein EDWATA_01389 [Edwardsiella tarda ATCC 23685]|uniref:Uncharacterized protein n=1 Tax=Edwardsiella tarda ATCC 23685 TaxID=500638 RepID=D4F3S4_EDWTA|nr:hypothetical protein EDWATA_01389 [Edwardsiella tarda ATCC 23685]
MWRLPGMSATKKIQVFSPPADTKNNSKSPPVLAAGFFSA